MYAGHTGTGFTEAEIQRLMARLTRLETKTCPFAPPPKPNERPHWVRPELVAEVRFTEWTDEGRLRHPAYLGLRDDVRPESVRREPTGRPPAADGARVARGRSSSVPRSSSRPARPARGQVPKLTLGPALESVIAQLHDLEERGRDGVITLPDGHRLDVGNLGKIFWPAQQITKGELLRYYVAVSPFLLPAVADRPLVMKRCPNGITGASFYQQRQLQKAPPGVRVETLPKGAEPIDEPNIPRFVGGSLTTLLYMAQLAAISQDPWFSRVASPLDADYAALDLDPMEGVTYEEVLDVARWIRDELAALGAPAVPKTSGASGLHIYVPLPPRTRYESGQVFCQIVATVVAARHPAIVTVERAVARRGRRVYIDFLQNILGKTLATAYSARASEYAGVSMPLAWDEVDAGVDPRDFTIRTAVDRLRSTGDLWARLRDGGAADLEAVFRKYGRG